MNFLNRVKYLIIAGTLVLVSVSSMASQHPSIDAPVSIINFQASVDPDSQKGLYQIVSQGLEQAKARVQNHGMDCHFHVNDLTTRSRSYHISIASFEAAQTDAPLVKSNSDYIWKTSKKTFQNHLGGYNQNGHVYGIHLYVHGFDADGHPINKHYSHIDAAKAHMGNDFDNKSGHNLTHFHIVARYGTSFRGGPKGQFAQDCEQLVDRIAVPDSKFANANGHLGKDFLGHITLAVGKKRPGAVTAQSEGFGEELYGQIIGMYEDVANDYHNHTKSQGRQFPIVISKFQTSSR